MFFARLLVDWGAWSRGSASSPARRPGRFGTPAAAMLAVVAPPPASDDNPARRQPVQHADDRVEPLVTGRGDPILPVTPLSGEADHGEADLGILKGDPLHHPTQLTPEWCLRHGKGALPGCRRDEGTSAADLVSDLRVNSYEGMQ